MNTDVLVDDDGSPGGAVYLQGAWPGQWIGRFEGDATRENGTYVLWLYDDEGRIVGRVDRSGHATAYDWDPAGNLLRSTFADGTK